MSSRRRFLRSLGLGGAALALPSVAWRNGVKADPDCPTRLIYFVTSHGAPRQHWKMDVPGLPTGTDGAAPLSALSEAEFSHALAPLHEVRDRISILDGLAMTSAMADEPGNNHGVAWAHLLTVDYAIDTENDDHPEAQTISIDQHIAQAVAQPGALPSVEWGNTGRAYSTAPDGAFLPVERNPGNAFDRLFPGGPTPPDMMEPTRRQLIQAQRGSVLDLAANEYDHLLPRLGADDRAKLEQHRDLIRDLELRLAGGGPRPATCDPNFDGNGETMDQFFRLAAIAASCDITRVMTLYHGQLRPEDFGAPPGDVHQDYAHGDTPESHMHMANYYRTHAAQFRDLVNYLDAIPEGDGTVLDNTAVIWMTELATGGHDMYDTMTIVAGGANGAFNPGRYVRYEQNRKSPCMTYGCSRGVDIGPAHTHLHIAAMQAMGLPDNQFGMSNPTALDGSTIDLTGPLPLI